MKIIIKNIYRLEKFNRLEDFFVVSFDGFL